MAIDWHTSPRCDVETAENAQRNTKTLIVRVAIGHDRIHPGLRDHRGKMFGG